MIQYNDTIIHSDVFNEYFICDLLKCKGACCVEGDWGAPLEPEELGAIKKNLKNIKPFMPPEAQKLLNTEGFFESDPDGDLVTTCLNKKECIFVYYDKGISKCAIEKAWFEGKSDFRKPVSCHLYPIRINKFNSVEAVNYDRWHICKPACELGAQNKMPVYKFLKEPLIRKYGEDWYKELEAIASALDDEKRKM